jgi:riboflavin-specific deaminase-like protein
MNSALALPSSKRPRVLANFAISLDGKVSTRNRTPSLFTSPRDKQRLLEIRSLGDALIVGRTTVEADTMSMGLPDDSLRASRIDRGQAPFPLRVVVSEGGNFNPEWKIFHSPGGRVLLFASGKIKLSTKKSLLGLPGVDLCLFEEFSIARVLRELKKRHDVQSVVCEGGPTLLRSLLEIDALDEIYLTFAPRIFGGEKAPTLTGCGSAFLPFPRYFDLIDFHLECGEVYAHYSRK